MATITRPSPIRAETLAPYRASFVRALRAENAAEKTIVTYSEALNQLEAFLVERGMPTTVDGAAWARGSRMTASTTIARPTLAQR